MRKELNMKTISNFYSIKHSKINLLFFKIYQEFMFHRYTSFFLVFFYLVITFGVYFNNIKYFNDLKKSIYIDYINILFTVLDINNLRNYYYNFYLIWFIILKSIPMVWLFLLLWYLKNLIPKYFTNIFKKNFLFINIFYYFIIILPISNLIFAEEINKINKSTIIFVLNILFFVTIFFILILYSLYNRNNFFEKKNYLNFFNKSNIFFKFFLIIAYSVIYSFDYNNYPKYIFNIALSIDLLISYFFLFIFIKDITFRNFFMHKNFCIIFALFLSNKLIIFITIITKINLFFIIVYFIFINMSHYLIVKKLIERVIIKFILNKKLDNITDFLKFYYTVEKLKENYKNNNKDKIYILGLLNKHYNNCKNITCFCKKEYLFDSKKKHSFINTNENLGLKIKYYIKYLLEKILKKKQKTNLLIFYLQFLFYKLKLIVSCKYVMKNINFKNINIIQNIKISYIEFSIKNLIEYNKTYIFKGISFLEIFYFEKKFDQLKTNMNIIIDKKIKFWNNFLNLNNINYNVLNNEINDIIKIKKATKDIFKDLKIYKNKSKLFNLYHIFFNKEFLNKKKIYFEDEILYNLNFFDNFSIKSNIQIQPNILGKLLFSKKSFSIHLDTYKNNIGTIKQISNGVIDVLNFQPKEIINKNLDFLLPKYLTKFHNYLLRNSIIKGNKNRFNGNEINSFAKNYNGNLVKVKIIIKYILFNNNCDLIGLIKENNNKEKFKDYFLLNEEGNLIGATKNFSFLNNYLKYKPNMLIFFPSWMIKIKFLKLRFLKKGDIWFKNLKKLFNKTNKLIKYLIKFWKINEYNIDDNEEKNFELVNQIGYLVIPCNLLEYLIELKDNNSNLKTLLKEYKNSQISKINSFFGIEILDRLNYKYLNLNDLGTKELELNKSLLKNFNHSLKVLLKLKIEYLFKINYNLIESSIKGFEKLYIIEILSFTKKNYFKFNSNKSLTNSNFSFSSSSSSLQLNSSDSYEVTRNSIKEIENQRKIILIFKKNNNLFYKDAIYLPNKNYNKKRKIKSITLLYFIIILIISLAEYLIFNFYLNRNLIDFKNSHQQFFNLELYLVEYYSKLISFTNFNATEYQINETILRNYPSYENTENNFKLFLDGDLDKIIELYNNPFIKKELNSINNIIKLKNFNRLTQNWTIINYIENLFNTYLFYKKLNSVKKLKNELLLFNKYYYEIFLNYFNSKIIELNNQINYIINLVYYLLYSIFGFNIIFFIIIIIYYKFIFSIEIDNIFKSLLCFTYINKENLLNIINYYNTIKENLNNLKKIGKKVDIKENDKKINNNDLNINKFKKHFLDNNIEFIKKFKFKFLGKLFLFFLIVLFISFILKSLTYFSNYYYSYLININNKLILDVRSFNWLILTFKELDYKFINLNEFEIIYKKYLKNLNETHDVNFNFFGYVNYVNSLYFENNWCSKILSVKIEIEICQQLYNNNIDKGLQNIKNFFNQKVNNLINSGQNYLQNFTKKEIILFDTFWFLINKIYTIIFERLDVMANNILNIIFIVLLIVRIILFFIYIYIIYYIFYKLFKIIDNFYNKMTKFYKHFIPKEILENKILISELQKIKFIKKTIN